jgi:hypothetical protein
MNKHQKNESCLSNELIKNDACNLNVLAIQIEMEEEQLLEWRNKRQIVSTSEVIANKI